jgi:hypothetical protein
VLLDNGIGAWAMELLHMVTEFGDLYGAPVGRAPSPGRYDEMDAADATHPCTFTKLKLGWLDPAALVMATPLPGGQDFTLHPLARLQPAPPGRVTALRVALPGGAMRYLMIEAREPVDDWEKGVAGFGAGIPGEGVVVYDVDESVWPPLWLRTSVALRVGESFADAVAQLALTVQAGGAGAGWRVQLKTTEPARCATIRAQIANLGEEITDLQAELEAAEPGAKSRIAAQIKRLQRLLAALRAEGNGLHCKLR